MLCTDRDGIRRALLADRWEGIHRICHMRGLIGTAGWWNWLRTHGPKPRGKENGHEESSGRSGIAPIHPSRGLTLCGAKRRCFGAPCVEKSPKRVRIEQIRVSGTLSGAAPERGSRWQTGDQRRNLRISAALSRFTFPLLYPVQHRKGPAMANRRPTPQPWNFGGAEQVRVSVALSGAAPERAGDGKPATNSATFEFRSVLATRNERQPCRLFPRQANQRRHHANQAGKSTLLMTNEPNFDGSGVQQVVRPPREPAIPRYHGIEIETALVLDIMPRSHVQILSQGIPNRVLLG